MPADLATLDALFAAATPAVERARAALDDLRCRDGEYVEHLCAIPPDPPALDAAAYIEATLPLMDARRRYEETCRAG